MIVVWNGIVVGLALAILVGPILFSLIQRSIEQGIKAGFWVASGIWISDVLFIVGIIVGVAHVKDLVTSPYFEPILGLLGGFVLIGIGAGMFVSKPATDVNQVGEMDVLSSRWRLWLEGFLINTINPFSVVFWTGLITAKSVEMDLFSTSSYLFFGAIMGTIVLTDSIKVVLAEKIRLYLSPKHILRMRKISGIALFLFGIGMMIRVTLF
ncbi:MAG: LysE family translocator [Bacteroidota bacterium]